MEEITVSVIIPVYNVEAYLKQCVDSVIAQNDGHMEAILIDDGSTDKSPEICDEYAGMYPWIHVIHKRNGGLSSARNAGIKAAKGKYLMFLDSDDWWNAEVKLAALLEKMEANSDVEMLLFNCMDYRENTGITIRQGVEIYHEKGIMNRRYYYLKLMKDANLQEHACTKILKRKFIIDNELYFREGLLGEDTEWIFRVLRKIKRIKVCNKFLYMYRCGREGSITNSVGEKNIKDIIKIIKLSVKFYQNNTDCSDIRDFELGHCAYLWLLALAACSKVDKKSRKALFSELEKLRGLAKYSSNKKVILAFLVCRMIGMNMGTKILSIYETMRNKNIIPKWESYE